MSDKKKVCIWLGEAGCVSVQVQTRVVSLSMTANPRSDEGDADGSRFMQATLYLRIEDAAALAELLGKVAAVHAENFVEKETR